MEYSANSVKTMRLDYILGIGRSGTTLLTVLLNNHSRIAVSPETYFIQFFAHSLSRKKEITEKDVDCVIEFLTEFSKIQPYIGWRLDFEYLKRSAKNPKNRMNFSAFCQMIHGSFVAIDKDYSEVSIQIDKNPSNSLYWKKIMKFDPKPRFIIAVRDYRANILSRKQSIHLRTGDFVYNAYRWNYFNSSLYRMIKKHPDRVHVVRYEDMVENPLEVCRRMCDFLEIPFEENMLEFYKKEVKIFSSEEVQEELADSERGKKKYSDLTRKIDASRAFAWKKELSEKEIEVCDIICGGTGAKFGYSAVKKYSFFQKSAVYLLTFPLYLKVVKEMLKDEIVYYLPVDWKLKRFKKYVARQVNIKR